MKIKYVSNTNVTLACLKNKLNHLFRTMKMQDDFFKYMNNEVYQQWSSLDDYILHDVFGLPYCMSNGVKYMRQGVRDDLG